MARSARGMVAAELSGAGSFLAGATALLWALEMLLAPQAAVTLAVFAAMGIVLLRGAAGAPQPFGAANRITLARAAAVALLAGLVASPGSGWADSWAWTSLAAVLFALDAVDGWIARRTGGVSAFGARFDMEVDAFFVLVLSVLLAASGRAGPWILLAGALRYAFVAAGWVWPRLAAPLPHSERRRVACALLVGALVLALAPGLAAEQVALVAAAALAVAVASFAIDTAWLLRATPEAGAWSARPGA